MVPVRLMVVGRVRDSRTTRARASKTAGAAAAAAFHLLPLFKPGSFLVHVFTLSSPRHCPQPWTPQLLPQPVQQPRQPAARVPRSWHTCRPSPLPTAQLRRRQRGWRCRRTLSSATLSALGSCSSSKKVRCRRRRYRSVNQSLINSRPPTPAPAATHTGDLESSRTVHAASGSAGSFAAAPPAGPGAAAGGGGELSHELQQMTLAHSHGELIAVLAPMAAS